MTYLLDAPALCALCWRDHPQHKKVISWIWDKAVATCALTEAALLVNSPVPGTRLDPVQAKEFLRALHKWKLHSFWPCDIKFSNPTIPQVKTADQLITGYLVAMAGYRLGKVASIDPDACTVPGVELITWNAKPAYLRKRRAPAAPPSRLVTPERVLEVNRLARAPGEIEGALRNVEKNNHCIKSG
jgi:hypothetical protein